VTKVRARHPNRHDTGKNDGDTAITFTINVMGEVDVLGRPLLKPYIAFGGNFWRCHQRQPKGHKRKLPQAYGPGGSAASWTVHMLEVGNRSSSQAVDVVLQDNHCNRPGGRLQMRQFSRTSSGHRGEGDEDMTSRGKTGICGSIAKVVRSHTLEAM